MFKLFFLKKSVNEFNMLHKLYITACLNRFIILYLRYFYHIIYPGPLLNASAFLILPSIN